MSPAVLALFELLRGRVTEQDVRHFSPSDPGYPAYVHCWTQILNSGIAPTGTHFDLSEVIGLVGWDSPDHYEEPNRFLTYRLFTSSVACHLYLTGNDSDCVHPVNYVAIRLIDDARDLGDPEIVSLVGEVLAEMAVELKAVTPPEDECPFLHAAEMVWAQRIGDYGRADSAAKTLLVEEERVWQRLELWQQHEEYEYHPESLRFLFGLTNYDTLNAQWNRVFAELTNPNDSEETQFIIDALTDEAKDKRN